VEDVRLMRASIPNTMKVKAAGGIRTVEQAEAFLAAGADRIGSSGILKSLGRA
jgi:deoxyribose-phosphate aldolase